MGWSFMADALQRDSEKRFTYADYCSWPEEERWELIDGVAFCMSPAPARIHSLVSMGLLKQLLPFFDGRPCEVHAAPFDVRLPTGGEPDGEIMTVVQPDILIVCDEQKLDDKGCRGGPDLVIEILSPSTASRDCIRKRALYEKHGIREYWLMDPANRIVTVYTLNSEGRFDIPFMYAESDVIEVSLFPGLRIDLTRVFPFQPKVVKESPGRYL